METHPFLYPFTRVRNDYCIYCNKFSPEGYTHTTCREQCKIERYISLYTYSKQAKQFIQDFKYYNKKDKDFDVLLLSFAQFIKQNIPTTQNTILIPLPLHISKEVTRGFNQTEVICKKLNRFLNIPVETELVSRTKTTLSQSQLPIHERSVNIRGVFEAIHNKELVKKQLILIDDVGTTGSTLMSCGNEVGKENPSCTIWAITIFR